MAKMSIKLASKGKTSFDLSSNHITTTDFGQLQVSNILPVVPGDKISASLFSEARFAPMCVPTFMDVNLVTRSFYVPMSAIWQPFEYFYTDKADASAYKAIPTFYNSNLAYCFSQPPFSKGVSADDKFDFKYANNPYIFTDEGRLVMKLLQSLGYSVNFASTDTTPMSFLPLLAFMRVCYDYVYPSQYIDGLGLTQYFKVTNQSAAYLCFNGTNGLTNILKKCLSLLALPYAQDYFTAAWNQLNNPGTSDQNITIASPASVSGYTEQAQSYDKAVELHHTGNNGNTVITQYGINLLSRLYDFVTRNNIVGTRYADQIFSRFGIGSRQSDPDMSRFIGQHIQPVNVVDVTAMSAADGQDLGDLAGKAYINGSGNLFSFDNLDEFGFIISLTHIQPKIGYYQGRKRWTTAINRFDFYTPEFDMQMRAIRNDELFADYRNDGDYNLGTNYGGKPDDSFALAPNYAEYKKGDDYITGDFRTPSINTGLDSYYIFRDIPMPSAANPLDLNSDFLFQQQHQFDKIFAQESVLRSPFTLREFGTSGSSLACYDGLPVVLFKSSGSTIELYVLIVQSNDKLYPRYYLINGDDDKENLKNWYGIDLDDDSTYYTPPTSEFTLEVQNIPKQTMYYIGASASGSPYNAGQTWYSIYDATNEAYSTSGSEVVSADVLQLRSWLCDDSYVQRVTSSNPTYDDFLSPYRSYLDHIYLRHHFDIKATRSMVPISEEFMIEDGGSTVSVDMNGNRF